VPHLTRAQGYHVQITARSDRDLTPEGIVQKVADASGAKYSAGSAPPPSSGPAPPVASKPAFTPTRSGAGGFNPLASSRARGGPRDTNVDDDGWGADAPPVTRTQIEKVPSAYQPTKVNISELTKQKQEPSRFNGASRQEDRSGDVVKGGYQPIGKVDIAAIRAQAQKTEDNRPTIVKGAYEPVGKVDIAAIRARAQKPSDEPSRISPVATGTSTASAGDEPKSLSDRSAAFTQSERLTALPKPKVANRFGSNTSNFTGTKPLTPGVFGLHSATTSATPAPVGAAKTFADEGGKTPAQIWAEKKARERGVSGAADTTPPSAPSPLVGQTSGGAEWKSGYTGKSWAPVAMTQTGRSGTSSIDQQRTGEAEAEEDTPSSAGGVAALKDRFKSAAPMGAPTIPRTTTGDSSPPPPQLNSTSKPTAGVPMPGLPTRPKEPEAEEEEEEQSRPNIPPPPAVPRSPTPPTPEARDVSPVRIAMPVARSQEPEIEAPPERFLPPAVPVESIEQHIPAEKDLTDEPVGHDPARAAAAAVAEASFGAAAPTADQGSPVSGKRALIQYDYERAEDNELELVEGEYVTNIEMVDEDWWMGTNSKGESGLFPSNYVELVEDDEAAPEPEPQTSHAPAPAPPPAAPAAASAPPASSGPTATALYDYEAAEDNELSFAEGATITGLVNYI
jgi:hypothetical protein